jgi:hypothetical protein
MGYESKLLIIRKTDVSVETDGFKYAEVMAVYEMGKFPPFQKIFNKAACSATKYCPVFGDYEVVEDMYGDPLLERSLDEVIDYLDQIIVLNDDSSKYERIRPLFALLQEYQKIQNAWYQLAVLHYGINYASQFLYRYRQFPLG